MDRAGRVQDSVGTVQCRESEGQVRTVKDRAEIVHHSTKSVQEQCWDLAETVQDSAGTV